MFRLVTALILFLFVCEARSVEVELLHQDRDVVWGFDYLDENRLVYTQKNGKLMLLELKSKTATELKGIPEVISVGQGGLLDVLVRREGDQEWLYWTYAKKMKDEYTTALARARLVGAKLEDVEELFVAKTGGSKTIHFGSRLVFDEEGHLYMTVGERGDREHAQSLDTHHGKVLRLTKEGKPAPGNPFKENPEVWTYGHRNPQGIAIHPNTKKIWVGEFGPRGGDELNVLESGSNYGWPIVTFGREYWGPKIGEGTSKPGMQDPVLHFTPSLSYSGIAFYDGDLLPEWKGSLLLACLRTTHLHRLVLNEENKVRVSEKLLENLNQRIRQVRVDPKGAVIVSTDGGHLYRLSPRKTTQP